MPRSCTVSLVVCGVPQGHEQVDDSHARLRPLPMAYCIPYRRNIFVQAATFWLSSFIVDCQRRWFTRTRHCYSTLKNQSWLIGSTAVTCDMLPTPHGPSFLAWKWFGSELSGRGHRTLLSFVESGASEFYLLRGNKVTQLNVWALKVAMWILIPVSSQASDSLVVKTRIELFL